MHEIRRLLRRAAWRLGLRRFLLGSARASAVLLGLVLALQAAATVVPAVVEPWALAAAALAAGALAGLVWALARRPRALTVASLVDHRAGLRDRLVTALELGAAPEGPIAQAQVRDASLHAVLVDLRAAIPIRPPRDLLWAAAAAALIVFWTTTLAGVTVPGTPARRAAEVARSEGRRLEALARRLEERARTERLPETRRAASAMRNLSERLQRERLDRAGALARLENLARQLEGQRRGLAERIQREVGQQPPQQPAGLPEDLFRPSTAPQITSRQLRELSQSLRSNPSAAQQQEIQERLRAMGGGQGQGGNLPVETQRKIDEAQRQLRQGNALGAGAALEDAAASADALSRMLADQEQIEGARREVRRSQQQVAGGGGREEPSPAAGDQPEQPARAPGENRPEPGKQGAESGALPEGPNEGTRPGAGQTREKLGAPTDRLAVEKERSRLRGIQGEGPTITSEVQGPGRASRSGVAVGAASPAVVRQADAYMARARIPGALRPMVLKYFQWLAQRR